MILEDPRCPRAAEDGEQVLEEPCHALVHKGQSKVDLHKKYKFLIPPSILDTFMIRNERNLRGQKVVHITTTFDHCLDIGVKLWPEDKDYMLSLQLSEPSCRPTLRLDFVEICDPYAPRFDVDMLNGTYLYYGANGRNLEEEIKARDAGLLPGQVRKGLGVLAELFYCLKRFCLVHGKQQLQLDAMFYHNAKIYKGYGFTCMRKEDTALLDMIDAGFGPEGQITRCLDGSTPFRQPGANETLEGRSWAIHDGILRDALGDVGWQAIKMASPVTAHQKLKEFTIAVETKVNHINANLLGGRYYVPLDGGKGPP